MKCHNHSNNIAVHDVEKTAFLLGSPPFSGASSATTTNEDSNDDHPLNQSTNVLLVYRLHEMRYSAQFNLLLAFLCLVYIGVNMVLIAVNALNAKAERQGTQPVVSELTYHLVEFWATFGFAVVECCSLVATGSPKSLVQIYRNPLVLKLVLFFNIVATWVPAVLVTLNREVFEITSHEIEYLNELTMTFVDMVLLWSLLRLDAQSVLGQFILTCMAGFVALFQLGVYNLMGRRADGDMQGEVPAHYFEFGFEIISSMIAFWFCMDNKRVAEQEIGLILYGSHADCQICDAKSNEFTATYEYPINAHNRTHHICGSKTISTLATNDDDDMGFDEHKIGPSQPTGYGSMSNV